MREAAKEMLHVERQLNSLEIVSTKFTALSRAKLDTLANRIEIWHENDWLEITGGGR